MLNKIYLLVALAFFQAGLYGQPVQPDVQDITLWRLYNRQASPITENGKKGIRLTEVPGNGLMILKNQKFSNGIIEMDIRGSNKPQQSFVGFAFHGQDTDSYDAVYFRPFNFKSDDPVRRSHAVQYISMPGNDWQKLRAQFPGKYENKIDEAPDPEEWFHVKIMVEGKRVAVFVNNEEKPVLEVDKLNEHDNGGIGFWVGNNSGGDFANLVITSSN